MSFALLGFALGWLISTALGAVDESRHARRQRRELDQLRRDVARLQRELQLALPAPPEGAPYRDSRPPATWIPGDGTPRRL